nr:orf34 [Ipomoea trifida]
MLRQGKPQESIGWFAPSSISAGILLSRGWALERTTHCCVAPTQGRAFGEEHCFEGEKAWLTNQSSEATGLECFHQMMHRPSVSKDRREYLFGWQKSTPRISLSCWRIRSALNPFSSKAASTLFSIGTASSNFSSKLSKSVWAFKSNVSLSLANRSASESKGRNCGIPGGLGAAGWGAGAGACGNASWATGSELASSPGSSKHRARDRKSEEFRLLGDFVSHCRDDGPACSTARFCPVDAVSAASDGSIQNME